MAEWIISGNPNKYNVIDAFHELGKLNWIQNTNVKPGDIVYIYVSGDIKAIKFKCRVNKTDLEEVEIDDRKYDLLGEYDGSYGRYMELEMIEEYFGKGYTREELMKHGFQSPQRPVHMIEKVKTYIDSLPKSESAAVEKKYSVEEAIWIAAALLSVEAYENIPDCSREDMYFKQANINKLAQTYTEGTVDAARCSWWYCADHEQSTHNYFRGDLETDKTARRLCCMGEFPEKTYPLNLNMEDELTINGRSFIMEELFYFVKEQYPSVIKGGNDIDYIGVLDYLRNNAEIPYSNPEAAGIAPEEKQRFLELKDKGQTAIREMKRMAREYVKPFHLDEYSVKDWLDGSRRKMGKYLWNQMKYGAYKDSPVSVSLFVEKGDTGNARYRVSLEIKNDNTDARMMERYRTFLDMPLNEEAGLVYLQEIGNGVVPEVLTGTWQEIREKILSGEIEKVRLCKCIERIDGETNPYYHREITAGIKAIIPYYEYVLGISGGSTRTVKAGEGNSMKRETGFDKNLILYGPPGTGKTYKSAIYAVAICDGKSVDELNDYEAVMERYNELKSEGRIAFTTFHQSYGYEEFIEGIKPLVDTASEDIGYKIEPGVFKEFCERAERVEVRNDKFEIPDDAKIWKVTVRSNVKEDCFEHDRVRIDWGMDSYGATGFVNGIKCGDIILTTDGSRSYITGIAIVTNEDAYSLEGVDEDKTTRDVQWLAKDINDDIKNINNGKMLHRMTCARVPDMKVNDIVELAMSHNPDLSGTIIEENDKPYVFIIDEINRGNISKIFGGLITLIETTKRAGMPEAASAILPYSGEEFSVPSNVYILGTMNTADRSIALMDTALRRRFRFIEMMPEVQVLREIGANMVEDLDVAAMLEKINERITFLYDREHTIGHAFFTGLRGENATIEKLQSIFEKSVIPLLQEYFYEDYEKIQLVLGDNAKSNPEYKFIRDDKVVAKNIFKGNVEDVTDLPEKSYTINKEAFRYLESYKEIL